MTSTESLLCLAAVLLVGCTQPAQETMRANKNFEVERLFEHEGCTAFRFWDGRYIYYVRCVGRVSVHSYYWQSTGKGGYYVDVSTWVEGR